jgi:hypothetical protein
MRCPHHALLIETQEIEGTSSTIAKSRIELVCSLEAGHAGEHRDATHSESWADKGPPMTTLLRHETE